MNLLYTEVAEGLNCYGVTRHRHMPEIEQVHFLSTLHLRQYGHVSLALELEQHERVQPQRGSDRCLF